MIKRIKIKPRTKEEDILMFDTIDKFKRVNVLVGGNGVGKTTLINAIKNNTIDIEFTDNNQQEDNEIIVYTDSEDNIKHIGKNLDHFTRTRSSVYLSGEELHQKMHTNTLSEGQSITYSLIRFIDHIKTKLELHNKDIIILFDEVDSGLSVENINMFIHLILEIIDENRDRGIQIVISSNNYHFTFVFKHVLNMYTGEFCKIESYEEYFELMTSNMVELGKKRNLNFI